MSKSKLNVPENSYNNYMLDHCDDFGSMRSPTFELLVLFSRVDNSQHQVFTLEYP